MSPGSRRILIAALDRATLESWVRRRTTPQRTVLRSRIVLALAEGLSAREVARRLGVSRHTVDLWRRRYLEEGCDALLRDRPGRGRRASTVSADCAIACEYMSRAEISQPAARLPSPSASRGRPERSK
jgi:transposase-like protein